MKRAGKLGWVDSKGHHGRCWGFGFAYSAAMDSILGGGTRYPEFEVCFLFWMTYFNLSVKS
jgi:hypothetical protein